jgi:hypothetical protein
VAKRGVVCLRRGVVVLKRGVVCLKCGVWRGKRRGVVLTRGEKLMKPSETGRRLRRTTTRRLQTATGCAKRSRA